MANGLTDTYDANVQKLRDLMKDIDMAMLTTAGQDGSLYSRPMSTQEVEFNGDLWFITGEDTPKVGEIKQDQHVNVAYVSKDGSRYVSVAGRANIVRDRQKIHEFWSPIYKIWFPNGEDDPNIILLKVTIDSAEYWESPSNKVTQLIGFVKAAISGNEEDMGENEIINLDKNPQVGA